MKTGIESDIINFQKTITKHSHKVYQYKKWAFAKRDSQIFIKKANLTKVKYK